MIGYKIFRSDMTSPYMGMKYRIGKRYVKVRQSTGRNHGFYFYPTITDCLYNMTDPCSSPSLRICEVKARGCIQHCENIYQTNDIEIIRDVTKPYRLYLYLISPSVANAVLAVSLIAYTLSSLVFGFQDHMGTGVFHALMEMLYTIGCYGSIVYIFLRMARTTFKIKLYDRAFEDDRKHSQCKQAADKTQ